MKWEPPLDFSQNNTLKLPKIKIWLIMKAPIKTGLMLQMKYRVSKMQYIKNSFTFNRMKIGVFLQENHARSSGKL